MNSGQIYNFPELDYGVFAFRRLFLVEAQFMFTCAEIDDIRQFIVEMLDNDCGMYIAQWLILYRLGGSYNVERSTNYSRIRLEVDMVLKHHNELRSEFIEQALQHWRSYVADHQEQL
ncbi:hypothetical protein PIB30_065225 [Stylosanthes scabra]|uniref:Ubiquitin-like protease family profile domain-containing protein n=1 Tax=Stylosanthes scabra TaxID=79078 RepID=A0ABU6WQ89_9FABA|nr:hypothetical protein [Stylosanthes scabra]